MAKGKPGDIENKTRIVRTRKAETVRERASKSGDIVPKEPRLRKMRASTSGKLRPISSFLGREYYLPLPDTKTGRFLNKRRSVLPKYFAEAWRELRQVKWPSRRETIKLTTAVFVFSIIFGLMVAGIDYLLDLIFKKVIL